MTAREQNGAFSWYLFGPDNRLQHDIAGTLGNGSWGYIVGTYDKDAGTDNQCLYLNGTRVAQMSGTQPIDLNAAALGIGRHVSGIADPFNGHIDDFRNSPRPGFSTAGLGTSADRCPRPPEHP